MLLFKKKYLPAIREGTKTQTIRLWTHRRMRSGQRSYIPGAGYIHVTKVEQIELDALTEDDATRDGFPSREALLKELEELYAEQLAAGYQAYRIRFELMSEEDSPAT